MNKNKVRLNSRIRTIKISGTPEISCHTIPEMPEQNSPPVPVPEVEISEPFFQISEPELNQQVQQAYQQGYNSKSQELQDNYNQQLRERFNWLTDFMTELQREKEEFLKTGEEIVLKLALAIARKIVHHEIKTNNQLILSVVRAVLNKISNFENKLTIRVNPADQKLLETSLNNFFKPPIHLKDIIFQADDRICKGGCRLESESWTIDAALETQLQEIEAILKKELEDGR